MGAVDITGETDQHAACIAAPIGGEETTEGRHQITAATVGHTLGQGFAFRGMTNQLQVIAQPLHRCAGHRDRTFKRVDWRLITQLIADGGQEAITAAHNLRAGV